MKGVRDRLGLTPASGEIGGEGDMSEEPDLANQAEPGHHANNSSTLHKKQKALQNMLDKQHLSKETRQLLAV